MRAACLRGERGLAAEMLGGADERGGALVLLGREQAQGVAHEDGDAGAAVARLVSLAHHPLQAPDRQRVGGQAQVRLGLAAAGGEEEEIDEARAVLGVSLGTVGVRGIGQ